VTSETPSLVVVTHDTLTDVQRAIASAREAGFTSIVVADAGSRDGTVDALDGDDVRVLALPNLGFGGCANRGVAAAHAGVVVISNADVTFEPGTAKQFADALADETIAAAGPLVRHPDGSRQHSARIHTGVAGGILHAALGLWWPSNPWTRHYRGADLSTDRVHDVDWVSGCCLAVRRDAFEDIGGFDPGYFLFMEDVDLCDRLRAAGGRVVFDPTVSVTHRVGGSLDRDRASSRRHHARSISRWAWRQYGPVVGALATLGAQVWRLGARVFDLTLGRSRTSTGEARRSSG
jgi:N-acetylglucosaminyl-diphospho-decaprenol L-rhamnosyltransferase